MNTPSTSAPNVPLDEPGDLRRIRELILNHRGLNGSPATTLVLVELLLKEIRSGRP